MSPPSFLWVHQSSIHNLVAKWQVKSGFVLVQVDSALALRLADNSCCRGRWVLFVGQSCDGGHVSGDLLVLSKFSQDLFQLAKLKPSLNPLFVCDLICVRVDIQIHEANYFSLYPCFGVHLDTRLIHDYVSESTKPSRRLKKLIGPIPARGGSKGTSCHRPRPVWALWIEKRWGAPVAAVCLLWNEYKSRQHMWLVFFGVSGLARSHV